MDEFEQRKKEVFQPIFFEAGAALFDCQSFEYGISYLLYLFARFGAEGLAQMDPKLILENEEKKTAGQLVGMLKKHIAVSEGIEDALSNALKARNKLIHSYLIDNAERMSDLKEHDMMAKEIRSLRSIVRKSHKMLEPFVIHLAERLDGFDIDSLAEGYKAKFMIDTKPH